MGPKVDEFSRTTAAQDPGVGETSHARSNLDRTAAGIIEDAPFEAPSVNAPSPARDWAVDEGDPEEAEDHRRHDASALCDRTHQNANSDSTKLELE